MMSSSSEAPKPHEPQRDTPKNIETLRNDIHQVKEAVVDEIRRKEPPVWKVFQVVLPVVLSSLLGLLVWSAKSNIETSITQSMAELNARLNLVHDVYRERLQAYKDLHERVIEIDTSLRAVQGSDEQKALHDSLNALSVHYKEYKLFTSDELGDLINRIWRQGIEVVRAKAYRSDVLEESVKFKENVEKQMRQDLLINLLDNLRDLQE